MSRGRYIVLDGGEGVGKTAQAQRLVGRLGEQGVTAEYVREPGGDPVGEQIRAVLLDLDNKGQVEPKTEVLLFNAARVQTLARIREKLDTGTWVVGDRSYASTLAYQGYGRQLELEPLMAVCLYALDFHPDLVIIMTCSYETALERRNSRGVMDRFEAEERSFHERVNHGFLEIAQNRRLPVVSAEATIDQVEDLLWAQVEPLIREED